MILHDASGSSIATSYSPQDPYSLRDLSLIGQQPQITAQNVWDSEDIPAGQKFEDFCAFIGRQDFEFRHPTMRHADVARVIAGHFKQYFHLKPPVLPKLEALLQELGIDLEIQWNAPKEFCGSFSASAATGWRIDIQRKGLADSRTILHELFEILFIRFCHRVPWWKEQMAARGLRIPHNVADDFAYEIIMPRDEFRDQAMSTCLDIWTLSRRFSTTPGICLMGLQRYVNLKCSYYIALLCYPKEITKSLFPEPRQVMVQRRTLKAPGFTDKEKTARDDFPHADHRVPLDDVLKQVFAGSDSEFQSTKMFLGKERLRFVDWVARPSPDRRVVCAVAVPHGFMHVLTGEGVPANEGFPPHPHFWENTGIARPRYVVP
ncbi:MAG: hypothetical protein M3Y56_05440 [Armatimonadota bacterium]|nr:hypothetical protein [Armatimonadota bacterium]